MCRIVIDVDDNKQYQFVLRKKSNYRIAVSQVFDSKQECEAAIDLFLSYCKDRAYWFYEQDKDKFHYAEWKKNGISVTTNKYVSPPSRKMAVQYIVKHFSLRTKITYITITR